MPSCQEANEANNEAQEGLKVADLIFFAPSGLTSYQLLHLANESTRIRLQDALSSTSDTFGFIGTIRWRGTIDGKLGDWLCIEWDEPKRGKNCGMHEDVLLATPVFPRLEALSHLKTDAVTLASQTDPVVNNSTPCSFLPVAKVYRKNIYHGTSLAEALAWRYQEVESTKNIKDQSRGDLYLETVSGQKKVVEFAGLKEAQNHFRTLSNLKFLEVQSLIISSCGSPAEWARTFESCERVNVTHLNILGSEMLQDWREVMAIVRMTPHLEKLSLSRCWRLGDTHSINPTLASQPEIRNTLLSLDLSGIPLTWSAVTLVLRLFTHLEDLTIAECGLSSETLPTGGVHFNGIKRLQLDLNPRLFVSANHSGRLLTQDSQIESLLLHGSRLRPERISALLSSDSCARIVNLGADQSDIETWKDFFRLASILPKLTRLSLLQSPLEISHPEELEEEKEWQATHRWRIPRSNILMMMAAVLWPDLTSYNLHPIGIELREEAAKYITALIRKNHPLILIHDVIAAIPLSEFPQVVLYLSELGGQETSATTSATVKSSAPRGFYIVLEPELSSFPEKCHHWLVPVKIKALGSMTLGQIIEIFLKRQDGKLRSTIDGLTLDTSDFVQLSAPPFQPRTVLSTWMSEQGIMILPGEAPQRIIVRHQDSTHTALTEEGPAGIRRNVQ